MTTATTWSDWRAEVPDHVLVQKVGEQAALLHLETECYFGLNPVAMAIWEAIGQTDTLGQAQAALLERYDVGPDRLADDMLALLGKLEGHGLVAIIR